jgi:hypothetical protein
MSSAARLEPSPESSPDYDSDHRETYFLFRGLKGDIGDQAEFRYIYAYAHTVDEAFVSLRIQGMINGFQTVRVRIKHEAYHLSHGATALWPRFSELTIEQFKHLVKFTEADIALGRGQGVG